MTPLSWIIPFASLLVAIAVLPLAAPHAWHQPRVQGLVAALAATPVLVRLVMTNPAGLAHVVQEYLAFVLMLGSLFFVTSGIAVDADFPAHPSTNAGIILLGGVLASIIGTTGASMLLIRLLLDINVERKRVAHTVIFFILVVSNIGGALTPVGDPPLLLGYLAGVPFFFTLKLLPHWGLSIAFLVAVYFVVDLREYRKETAADIVRDETTRVPLTIRGGGNVLPLAGVIACTALLGSPWRELGYLACVLASFVLTPKELRQETSFTWAPMQEVAILFAGIFVAMEPALQILRERGASFGIVSPWQFFWISGALSAFLDNAPTYAAFLALARGLGRPEVAGAPAGVLVAISAGSVFFGALTYIGNGPNFLVRSIAASRGVTLPSFFGYFGRAALILVPLFVLQTLIFFI